MSIQLSMETRNLPVNISKWNWKHQIENFKIHQEDNRYQKSRAIRRGRGRVGGEYSKVIGWIWAKHTIGKCIVGKIPFIWKTFFYKNRKVDQLLYRTTKRPLDFIGKTIEDKRERNSIFKGLRQSTINIHLDGYWIYTWTKNCSKTGTSQRKP